MKIAILASHTIRWIKDDKHEWYICEYDQIRDECLDPDSQLYRFEPDAVLISCFDEQAPDIFDSVILRIGFVPVFIHTIPPVPHMDAISRIETNLKIMNFAHPVDLDALISKHGTATMYNMDTYYLGDVLFGHDGCHLLKKQFLRALRAKLGKRKKCLIVDLDNTLWHGLISDGIEITKAHKQFQREIKKLVESGVILAICSKNDEEQALQIFQEHPDMVLKKEDLATWRINWSNKSDNIRSIAEELGISLDSFVFLDDNPQERVEVQNVLPEVLSPTLPESYSGYPSIFEEIEELDTFNLTETDKTRNQMYVQERKRKESGAGMSREKFLHSLGLKIRINKMTSLTISRIAQLSERTNQFNFTGKVFSIEQLMGLEAYTITSEDKFGSQGIVGACVLDGGNIIGLYMSCRILGRGIEDAFLTYFYPSPFVLVDTGKNKAALDFVARFKAETPSWIEVVDEG
jgi:FkbH-like protein